MLEHHTSPPPPFLFHFYFIYLFCKSVVDSSPKPKVGEGVFFFNLFISFYSGRWKEKRWDGERKASGEEEGERFVICDARNVWVGNHPGVL